MSTNTLAFDEDTARRVLLLQAFESGADSGSRWTPQDGGWATRLARETTPAGAPAETFLAERARHALQRLQSRDAAIAPLLAGQRWRPIWGLAAVAAGFAAGLLLDAIGNRQHINLLAPPVWLVIAWNLIACLLLVLPLRWPRVLQGWLARRLAGAVQDATPQRDFHTRWLRAAAPLWLARATGLLHLAALALAAGLVASLYLRGLVLDYRAGWQSTFLNAQQVQAVLATLLAPASAVSGIPVPDAASLQSMRAAPGAPPTASAAPWIHLYATLLALFVGLPRLLLAAWSAWRARVLSRRLPLPAGELYFQRLLNERQGAAARVQLLPHGAAPAPPALAGLRLLLAAALGDSVQIVVAPPTAYGDEDQGVALAAQGHTLRLLLADLGATPEDDTHGRFLLALRRGAPAVPVLLLLDESRFVARFATLPARLAERRAAWAAWSSGLGCGLWCADLEHPDLAHAPAALQAALRSQARSDTA